MVPCGTSSAVGEYLSQGQGYPTPTYLTRVSAWNAGETQLLNLAIRMCKRPVWPWCAAEQVSRLCAPENCGSHLPEYYAAVGPVPGRASGRKMRLPRHVCGTGPGSVERAEDASLLPRLPPGGGATTSQVPWTSADEATSSRGQFIDSDCEFGS